MAFKEWLMNIFRISSGCPPKPRLPVSSLSKKIEQLDKRKSEIINEKRSIIPSSQDWFGIKRIEKSKPLPISTFKRYVLQEIPTLNFLKKDRLRKEGERIAALENSITAKLQSTQSHIAKGDAAPANKILQSVTQQIQEINNPEILSEYKKVLTDLSALQTLLYQREIKLKAEQDKREANQRLLEEEKKKKREAEERRLRVLAEQKRQKKAREFTERLKAKELAEQNEKNRLLSLSLSKKSESNEIKNWLKANGVSCFYHFTDVRNLPSIRMQGGLLSWHYCKIHGIAIPFQGGNSASEVLDKRYGLEDFVRLSFCNDHPMAWRLQTRGNKLVLLKIKIDVACFRDTQFSDINAADSSHIHGPKLEHLKMINISATKRNYVSKTDPDFKPHQAEVMVKTFVPMEYIINIDNPIPIN